jgi:antitoxin component YwqK of YwqJK toxin-antitoxin module
MKNEKCDLIHQNGVKEKTMEIMDGYTIKYHANGTTIWSKGKMVSDNPDGYWEWYRPDGTIKRSGYFEMGKPIGEWITYDNNGKQYKSTNRVKKA